jgi:hypothetical protein
LPLPNRVVNIGQDAQWNVSKHRICKLSTKDCFSGNIWLWLLSQNDSSKMAPFWPTPGIGHHFGMRFHASSDVDDVI